MGLILLSGRGFPKIEPVGLREIKRHLQKSGIQCCCAEGSEIIGEYYTTFIKFGIGRATYDASQEIRNRHLTREEGVPWLRGLTASFQIDIFRKLCILDTPVQQ